ncbi:MAG: GAF domain-containing protein, partial [Anaerolineae bacterium]
MSTNPKMAPATARGAGQPYRRDLALLRMTLAILDSSLELDQILGRLLETLLDTFGAGSAGLVLVRDPAHPGFEVLAHRGLPAERVPRRIFVSECPCRQAIGTAMPFFEPHCPGWKCLSEFEMDPPHSHLIIPLKIRQQVLGLICLHCRPDFEIDDWDLSLWEDLGIQVGKRIEESRLQAQLQQDRDLLYTLYAVSDHLATSLDVDWVLSRVLDLSISATNARDGSIFLLPTPEGRSSRILRRDLPPAEADQVIHQVLTHGVAGWVVRHQEGTIIPDAAADPKWYSFPNDPQPPGSVLAVPLVSGGRILGVITLDHSSKNHFRQRHLA